ncbi:MAG: DUF3313 family protein [Deltaproteobacteria bacterium]|jgi:hypothetical protein|nr:DUF3313 family protein [Deltaproteobacteria bacterium]
MPNLVRTLKAVTHWTCAAFGFALLALWLGSPASANTPPASETESKTATLENGLQLAPTRGPGMFWVRPGVDLRAYDRVALRPVSVEYKENPRHYRLDPSSAGVLLTERDLERLQQSFYDIFKTGLANGAGFGPASEPDPGLLWVSTSLLDVVVHNNDAPISNELNWINNFGEMTLRVEFSDSETGQTVARFEERRTIGPSGAFIGSVVRKDRSYWSFVRANFTRWSELVRQRMHEQRTQTAGF